MERNVQVRIMLEKELGGVGWSSSSASLRFKGLQMSELQGQEWGQGWGGAAARVGAPGKVRQAKQGRRIHMASHSWPPGPQG